MKFKKGETVEVIISDLAFGGAGIGRVKMEDNRDFVIFVDGAAPGDTVLARITGAKKNFAEATVEKIITPSKDRVTPRCKHFGICGGCTLQFLSYEDQLKWKEKMVSDALKKIGGLKNLEILPILGCETPWFYRNKMEYSFADEWPDSVQGRAAKALMLGLHPAKKYREVFDVEECFLESEISVSILDTVRTWARENKIPPFNYRTNAGVLKNLVVREGKNTGEILVNIITSGDFIKYRDVFKTLILSTFPTVTSVYHTEVITRKGHKTVVQENLLAGSPTLSEILKIDFHNATQENAELKFQILPQAFFQPNTLQAQTLYKIAYEFASPNQSDIVLDLFCGTGTIGMFFAANSAHTIGIDINESAITNAKENAAYNNLKNIEFLCGDAGAFLKNIQHKPTILITDPPRNGIEAPALTKILEMQVPRWVYVSCNPTTLARDLAIITLNGYRVDRIQPVDMFPQTYHVETVVLLSRQIP